MNPTLKTIVLAATGAALLIASPALAQTKRHRAVQNNTPVQAVVPFVPGGPFWENLNAANDPFGQIRDEYLKDAPIHNGNSY